VLLLGAGALAIPSVAPTCFVVPKPAKSQVQGTLVT
jgi:hypothetical protein